MDAFIEQCRAASLRTFDWLEARLDLTTGSFGSDAHDLAAYYKAPAAMHLAGRPRAAYALVDFIAKSFLQPDGDFLTEPGKKTSDAVLSNYPGYLNGWIIMGAHRSSRFELSHKGWEYFRRYQDPQSGACLLEGPFQQAQKSQREILMTAHLGLAALYMGDLRAGEAAGDALIRFYESQPDPTHKLYLRMDSHGELVTTFPAEATILHVIDASQAGQAWFFVGYPIAFLSILHRATGNQRHLDAARSHAEFALACGERLTKEHFGHKAGWGAALLFEATGDERYRDLARAVAESLMASQAPDGGFLPDAPLVSRLDQSAEVAQWLLEISALIR